jgi:hypothetical protein
MTEAHRAVLTARYPDAAPKTHLLKAFDQSDSVRDLPDPIGSSIETYRRVRDDIAKALPDLQIFLHEKQRVRASVKEGGESQ